MIFIPLLPSNNRSNPNSNQVQMQQRSLLSSLLRSIRLRLVAALLVVDGSPLRSIDVAEAELVHLGGESRIHLRGRHNLVDARLNSSDKR